MDKFTNETLDNAINAYKTVIEAFENSSMNDEGYDTALDKCTLSFLEELKDYRQKKEHGKLLELPCEVGTRVWTILCGMTGKNPILFRQEFELSMLPHWGTAVFLTKEEAEAAVVKMMTKAEMERCEHICPETMRGIEYKARCREKAFCCYDCRKEFLDEEIQNRAEDNDS